MKLQKAFTVFFLFWIISASYADNVPEDFIYLKDIDPTIVQDIRYASSHNFIGHPIKGYDTAKCVLTRQAAQALLKVQVELLKSSLALKVYDCYRPQMAVDEFKAWSENSQDIMHSEFYPNVPKHLLFKKGYLAEKSGHSRGSTVDLTIVPVPTPKQLDYHPGDQLSPCNTNYAKRYHDNSIDMGTGYDCMDRLSHPDNKNISKLAYHNRLLLNNIMQKYGFEGIETEWWHFTLKNEPYPNTYFNFPIK